MFLAAHCLVRNATHQASASEVRVSVGSSYRLGTGGVFYDVFRLIRHPEYFLDNDYINADVAVVRLIWPLVFSRIVQPIPLGDFRVEAGDRVMVTGEFQFLEFHVQIHEIFLKNQVGVLLAMRVKLLLACSVFC